MSWPYKPEGQYRELFLRSFDQGRETCPVDRALVMAGVNKLFFRFNATRAHRSLDTVGVHPRCDRRRGNVRGRPSGGSHSGIASAMVLFVRYRHKPVLEPRPQCASTSGFVWACRTARRSSALRPRIRSRWHSQCCDLFQRLQAIGAAPPLSMSGRSSALPVQPAISERHRASITPWIRQLFVDRIAVALHVRCRNSPSAKQPRARHLGRAHRCRATPVDRTLPHGRSSREIAQK